MAKKKCYYDDERCDGKVSFCAEADKLLCEECAKEYHNHYLGSFEGDIGGSKWLDDLERGN